MLVRGIDPGPNVSHWVDYIPAFDGKPGTIARVHQADNPLIEDMLMKESRAPNVVICEGMGAQGGSVGIETFDTAIQIGGFRLACRTRGKLITFEIMNRSVVKEFLLGAPTGKDADISAALKKYFGVPLGAKKSEMGPLKDIVTHLWAALAVCVAWEKRETMRRRAEAAR